MGSLGRITSLKDLPSDKQMLGWLRQAADFVDSGQYTSPIAARRKVVKAPKPVLETPAEFAAALKRNKKAAAIFAAFSPSCKREYIEWIADAKRRGDAGQTDCNRGGVDRGREAAQLEISKLLISYSAGSPVGSMPLFSTIRTTVRSGARVRWTTRRGTTKPCPGSRATVRGSRSMSSCPSTT